jgi:hypothetical protein
VKISEKPLCNIRLTNVALALFEIRVIIDTLDVERKITT